VLLLAGPALLLATGISCDDHVIGHGVPITNTCLRDPPLTWENYGDYIIGRQCRPCHSVYSREGQRADAPEGVDFDSWDDVLEWVDRIQARSVDTETMPPAGGMLREERVLLGEWLRCEVYPALGQQDLSGVE
jgi:cytochrome c5